MTIEIIIKVAIPILGAILTYMIIPYLKAKTTSNQREYVYEWVKMAVYAAEQMAAAGLINIPKKEYVVNYINRKLEEKEIKLKLTVEDLNAMIEAAVRELRIAQGELGEGGK